MNWDDDKFESYLGTWMTVDELDNVISVPASGGSNDCTCKYRAGCAGWLYCDHNSGCDPKPGCGLFGGANCSGLCPDDKLTIANPGG